MNITYEPEQKSNSASEYTKEDIEKAIEEQSILSSIVSKCDKDYKLYLNLGHGITGVIKRTELEYPDNNMKNIAVVSKVGKVLKFKVMNISKSGNGYIVECSRALVQKEFREKVVSSLKRGDVLEAYTTHITDKAIYCDIGCGVTALLPVKNISTVRIAEASKKLHGWSRIKVVVDYIDSDGKIFLTHKELLGTWDQVVEGLSTGDVVRGIVTEITEYGAFIGIRQNLSGLTNDAEGLEVGDSVTVRIKEISEAKMKVRLAVINKLSNEFNLWEKPEYKCDENHIDTWVYSPVQSSKLVCTRFSK